MTASALPLLCALLRGESPSWPGDGDTDVDAFLHEARYHGVLPLVDACFRESASGTRFAERWPASIRNACRDETRFQAIQEAVLRNELVRVLEELAKAGIVPLILKGAALAYSHYPAPVLRPRGDTDLLVRETDRRGAEGVLAQLGYRKGHGVTGTLISYEADWRRDVGSGVVQYLDLHWKINNSQMLAKLLTFDELRGRAVPVPGLGERARAPCAVHALLYACMHRAGHANVPYVADGHRHLGGDRLIWLYDMHLLVTRMSGHELSELVALATAKQLKGICGDALQTCVQRFGTPVPSSTLAGLMPAGRIEPSSRYLSGGRGRQMVGDFLALDSIAERLTWLREIAFPSADYMRLKYPASAGQWLLILYARRGLNGLRRLVAGNGSKRSL